MSIDFSVAKWCAWSPGVETQDDWLLWANNKKTIQLEGVPACSFLPALQRRRLSRLGKMALQVAEDCLQGDDVDHIIFSSRHGEPERTEKMLRGILETGEISPTQFSLSVHNTFSGLFSIHKKNITPTTAIAAGKNTFFTGLVKAASLLKTGRAKKVLFVFYEEPLPATYEFFADEKIEPFALALLLEVNHKNLISLQFDVTEESANSEWGVLTFFKSFLLCEKESYYISERLLWRWVNNDATV